MRPFIAIALTLLLTAGCISGTEKAAKKADKLHKSMLTVDTHCDTPLRLMRSGYDLGERHEKGCVDFPRMKEGGLSVEFLAVFTGQGPRNQQAFDKVYNYTLQIFDSIQTNVERNNEMAGMATTPEDAEKLFAEGRAAIFTGVENGYPIGLDIKRVEEYYNRGARYITLCHSFNNDICDSSTDPAGAEHNGLSPFGVEVVKEMNRLGMMVDVSHMSDKSFFDVLSVSEAPILASHSSCRALCESPRNLSDDMLLALKENGGVIQICILSSYLKQPDPNPEFDSRMAELEKRWDAAGDSITDEQREKLWNEYSEIREKYEILATVEDAVNHIQHVVDVIGVDYVGIGTDFDGGGGIEGCKDVSQMKNITIELIKRGFSNEDIAKIWGGNVMRVMRRVKEVSREN